jgi:NTP pyrophosphatase (non-canonical NTP hydrolase)
VEILNTARAIGEIARQLVNRKLAIRKYEESNLKEEITQAILDLLVLSEIFNVDLSKAITGKIDEMARKAQISSQVEQTNAS